MISSAAAVESDAGSGIFSWNTSYGANGEYGVKVWADTPCSISGNSAFAVSRENVLNDETKHAYYEQYVKIAEEISKQSGIDIARICRRRLENA